MSNKLEYPSQISRWDLNEGEYVFPMPAPNTDHPKTNDKMMQQNRKKSVIQDTYDDLTWMLLGKDMMGKRRIGFCCYFLQLL